MGVDKPNYTQIPNLLLDDLLMLMSDAEMKVTLAIARRTFGYHRDTVEISISQLKDITHLSKQGVVNGINAGLERGTITRTEGKRGGFVYELVINGEHPSTCQPSRHVNQVDSQRSRPPHVNQVDTPSQPSRQVPVNEVDQNTPVLKKVLKKETLKKESKESTATQERTPTPQQEMFGAVCEAVGWDHNTLTQDDKGQVAQAVGVLLKAEYTVGDLRRFMIEIWFHDWRWQKHQQRPTLKQIRQDIGKLRAIVPEQVPRNGNGVSLPLDKNQAAADQVRALLRAKGKEDILHG